MAGQLNIPNPKTGAVRGRLAPSPTGLLHLGNAWAFFMAWLLCRREGGCLVLRMEDIDPARSRPHFAAEIVRDLHWLGLDWDEGVDDGNPDGVTGLHAPYMQRARSGLYEQALRHLDEKGLTYPCFCTRKELRALAGAPHVGDEGAPYPGTCRNLTPEQTAALRAQGRQPSVRIRCPDTVMPFTDIIQGTQKQTLAASSGDFALRRSDGVIAYQLAVVVDDGLMGITQVVRGRDILTSTSRQLFLFDALGLPCPIYAHLPLICDNSGERLAKRHESLSLRALRLAGVSPYAVIGYLAWKSGLAAELTSLHPRSLLSAETPSFPTWWRERDIVLDADPVFRLRSLL